MSEQDHLFPEHPGIAIPGTKWHDGAGPDGKHYWLTPADLMARLQGEFGFDFDACPYPVPEGFDGLTDPWGQSTYVNPPFGAVIHQGKKKGPTAWARKAIAEAAQGKRVVLVYPIDKWILMLLAAGAQVRNLGDVKWCAIEDGQTGQRDGAAHRCVHPRAEAVPARRGRPAMTTFAELFCRVEASDLPEDVKETAIGALFDESMRNRGIVFASPEQRADVYSRVRAAIRKEFVKGRGNG